jgi:prevent-host-death family protein
MMSIMMDISEKRAPRKVSIADARDNLPSLVRSVEQGQPVELTRRGTPVAVLVSTQEYRKLTSGKRNLWQAIQEFRRTHELAPNAEVDEIYANVRDTSPGREVDI